jgi:hypothetical protein
MIFDHKHYVPILKTKRGEKTALSLLSAPVKNNITPLFEVVERTDKDLPAHLDTAFNGLAKAVAPFTRIFLDSRELVHDGTAAADAVFSRACVEGIVFTPVTGISRNFDLGPALLYNVNGLALRLTREEFEAGNLDIKIIDFLNQHSLIENEIDLIVDLGSVDELIKPGVTALATAFLSSVPKQDIWRTFTLSACAFPKGLGLSPHTSKTTPRTEWLSWLDINKRRNSQKKRLPTYSDTGIQHPAGVEGFDPKIMPTSAAIRYTSGTDWLLIKGESTRITGGKIQYKRLASSLAFGGKSSHFAGETHCEGCRGVQDAANGATGHGSGEVWRRHGTIHHITVTSQNIASLSWP